VSGLKPDKQIDGKFLLIKTDVPQMSVIRIPIHVLNMGHPPIWMTQAHGAVGGRPARKKAPAEPEDEAEIP